MEMVKNEGAPVVLLLKFHSDVNRPPFKSLISVVGGIYSHSQLLLILSNYTITEAQYHPCHRDWESVYENFYISINGRHALDVGFLESHRSVEVDQALKVEVLVVTTGDDLDEANERLPSLLKADEHASFPIHFAFRARPCWLQRDFSQGNN